VFKRLAIHARRFAFQPEKPLLWIQVADKSRLNR